jgi:hypothetical protein
MSMSLDRALRTVQHAAYNDASVPALDIVNEAGIRLFSMHPWRFLNKPPVQLSLRAPISFTGATYTEATKTLSGLSISAYSHANGDSLSISSGTGASVRDYTIVSATATAAVLSESIGSGADGKSDIAGTINAGRAVVLPSDFGAQLKLVTTGGLTQHISFTSQQRLIQARSRTPSPPLGVYWASIFTAKDLTTAGGAPTYRLELYPDGTAADPDFLTVSYQVAWEDVTEDAQVISIPWYTHPIYTQILRAITRGYEEEEQATVDDHIDRIKASSAWFDATSNDGLVQPDVGELQGGNEMFHSQEWWPYPTEYVADP